MTDSDRPHLHPHTPRGSRHGSASSALTWKADDRFVLGETTFRAMWPGVLIHGAYAKAREGEFFIFKTRSLVERYAELIKELEPQHVFELGILQGGSTLFFAQLARPRRLVAIDRRPLKQFRSRVESYAAREGFSDVVRTFGEVDQADRQRLAEIVEEAFDGAPLDLVVDDCSHLYEETRASFNELFPRLRPGGVYVIEDWPWAHLALGAKHSGLWTPGQVPLTRLLFEIVLAVPAVPGLIAEISIDSELALIRRGDTRVEPETFEVSACSSTPSGRVLLAPA
jgi:predicted O-methyltransferase YrrM